MTDNPDQPEDALLAVALIRAAIADDLDGQQVLLDAGDPIEILAATAGLTVSLGMLAYGSVEALDAHLAKLQTRLAMPGYER